jgi:hypothetical protein
VLQVPRSVPKARALVTLAASLSASTLAPGAAHAEPSSWVYVGGGAIGWRQGTSARCTSVLDSPTCSEFRIDSLVQADFGMGTSPSGPVVVGGLARAMPYFGDRMGMDVALLARVATGGFARSSWGAALDAGGYVRFWGAQSQGFTGGLTLGAPLGFTLSLLAMVGTDEAIGFGGSLGIDFAKLLLHRTHLRERWPNPAPSQRAYTPAAGPGPRL